MVSQDRTSTKYTVQETRPSKADRFAYFGFYDSTMVCVDHIRKRGFSNQDNFLHVSMNEQSYSTSTQVQEIRRSNREVLQQDAA